MHPLYLMLPATISCSYAFMLPVANPPNAIAFNASTMKNSDMVYILHLIHCIVAYYYHILQIKAGFTMNVLCIFIMTGLINTLGVALFGLDEMPLWALQANENINSTLIVPLIANDTSTLVPYS